MITTPAHIIAAACRICPAGENAYRVAFEATGITPEERAEIDAVRKDRRLMNRQPRPAADEWVSQSEVAELEAAGAFALSASFDIRDIEA